MSTTTRNHKAEYKARVAKAAASTRTDEAELIARIQAALGTDETGDNLVAVARDAHEAELRLSGILRTVNEP